MSEDALLLAIETIQGSLTELRKEMRSVMEKLTLVTAHEIRLARVEVDVEALKERMEATSRLCASRQKYVDMLNEGMPESPQVWWNSRVAEIAGLLVWSIALLLLPKILKALGVP